MPSCGVASPRGSTTKFLPGLFGSSVGSYGYAQGIARPFYCWMHTSGHIRGRQHSFRLTRGQLQATFTWYGFANTWTLHETIRHFRVDMLRPHMRPFDLLTAVHHHQHTTHSPSPITTQHHSQPSPTTHYPPCNPPTTKQHQQHTTHHPNQPPTTTQQHRAKEQKTGGQPMLHLIRCTDHPQLS